MKLVNWIKSNIADGTFTAGKKIPTELELSEQFSISRNTVRQALAELEKTGCLYRVQGGGTYISDQVQPATPKQPVASKTIGLVFGNSRSYVFPDIAQGASDYLASKGYLLNILFSECDFMKERQIIEMLLASKPAGILIEPANSGIQSLNDTLFHKMAEHIPTIFLHLDDSMLCPTLPLYDREGARMLMEYLLQMGHTQIGTIFAFKEATGQARYLGFLDALHSHGLPHSDDIEIWLQHSNIDDYFQKNAEKALHHMLEKVTAIFCHNDCVAYSLITYLRTIGIRVPEDISVVGYDDSLYATLDTQLTTVTHPKIQYGVRAAQAILGLIENPDGFRAADYAIHPQLVIRNSVSPLKT
ncbi:GntR family transcriptional regulator [Intestinibacillus massiliensis]